jgi:hypothetical protein
MDVGAVYAETEQKNPSAASMGRFDVSIPRRPVERHGIALNRARRYLTFVPKLSQGERMDRE